MTRSFTMCMNVGPQEPTREANVLVTKSQPQQDPVSTYCQYCNSGVPLSKLAIAGYVGVAQCMNQKCPKTMELLARGVTYPDIRCADCGKRDFFPTSSGALYRAFCNCCCGQSNEIRMPRHIPDRIS